MLRRRQLPVMNENRRCSILFPLLVTTIRTAFLAGSSMAFAITHLQRSAHARLYRRRTSRWRGVDDDPTNVEVLRVRLSAQGYEVITAVDGEEALQRARELD